MRIAVVGAGISGLGAAYLLSRAHEVELFERESKAGGRKYVGWDEVPRVLNGMGIAVVSTSKGILSDRQCRQQKLGGELVCTLY